jgi:hypothetical protein
MSNHYQVLVIGGNAGLCVLQNCLSKSGLKIGIVDPSRNIIINLLLDTCRCWNFDIKKTIRNERSYLKHNLDKRCSFSI